MVDWSHIIQIMGKSTSLISTPSSKSQRRQTIYGWAVGELCVVFFLHILGRDEKLADGGSNWRIMAILVGYRWFPQADPIISNNLTQGIENVTGDHFQFKISQPPMHRPCTMSRALFVAREFLIECANQVAPDGGRLPCQCWTTHTSSQMYHRFDLFGPLTSSIFYHVDINIIRYLCIEYIH